MVCICNYLDCRCWVGVLLMLFFHNSKQKVQSSAGQLDSPTGFDIMTIF